MIGALAYCLKGQDDDVPEVYLRLHIDSPSNGCHSIYNQYQYQQGLTYS